jgi:hypothetical protein
MSFVDQEPFPAYLKKWRNVWRILAPTIGDSPTIIFGASASLEAMQVSHMILLLGFVREAYENVS